MSPAEAPGTDREQPFFSHLVELRSRLLKAVAAILLIFIALAPFANNLYALLARPLLERLPVGSHLIAIGVASPFLTPFKLALITAIFLAMPVVLYQLWAFVAPGLYRHERRFGWPLWMSSIVLFYGGVAFAYFVVFPMLYAFFLGVAPAGVDVTPDINENLDFVLTLFFAFGLAFEVPIATVLAVAAGITTPSNLRAKRPYVVVAAFIIGMLLTPPDVISQTLLAIPMWGLFELGIFFSRWLLPKAGPADNAEP